MAESTDFKYWPINWVDGMLLNKDMLSHQDSFYSERISDAVKTGLSPYNYGVLQRAKTTENCIVKATVDNRTSLRIIVQKCIAVTPNGNRISIPGDEWELEETIIELKDIPGYSEETQKGEFYVVLAINSDKTVECGTPDPEEEPLRYPNCRPNYSISIVPVKIFDKAGPAGHTLPIAMLRFENGELKQAADYLPPCSVIQSNADLHKAIKQLEQNLQSLENSAITIIQKVRSKHQQNMLALGINSMAEQIVNNCSSLLPFLNVKAQWSPLIDTMVHISAFARSIKNSLDTWQGMGKEEILNYLAEWCSLNQGAFEKNLKNLISLKYKHHNMNATLQICNNFFDSLTPVFIVLADLDYIGKKIDNDLFVKEDVINFEEETVKTKGKKSGLFRK